MASYKKYSCFFIIVCLGYITKANNVNLEVGEVTSYGIDSVKVELIVSWQNSWDEQSTNLNHDAVWLFTKYKTGNGWLHQNIDSVYSDDFEVFTSTANTGCLLKPFLNSEGNIFLFLPNNGVTFYFSAIELVYIPEGDFLLGDSLSNHSFSGKNHEPLRINSEASLVKDTQISSLTPASIFSTIPADYPKGYKAFYCMKYEISQEQISDFLNHISLPDQLQFLGSLPEIGKSALKSNAILNVNGVMLKELNDDGSAVFGCDLNKNGVFNELDDGQTLACNFLSWEQLQMYLDWSGLRPMTELEFEKAARGFAGAVKREFAFGSDKITDANILLNEFTSEETYTERLEDNTGIGAHGYLGRQGPLRCGFASGENTDRLSSGASYWGLMELSGNLWEQTFSVSKQNGLLFKGSHGDGSLSNGLPADWRLASSIVRGGAWNSGIFGEFRDLAVSDRYYYNLSSEVARNTTGGRGVISLTQLR